MARCTCSDGGPCLSSDASNLARYDASGCLLVQAPAGANGTVQLSSDVLLDTASNDVFLPVGNLSLTLPAAGVYLVQADLSALLHIDISAGAGGATPTGSSYARINARLYNVTAGAAVAASAVQVVGIGARLFARFVAQGTGTPAAIVTVTGATTIRAEASISRAPSSNTIATIPNTAVAATYSHMHYVKLA